MSTDRPERPEELRRRLADQDRERRARRARVTAHTHEPPPAPEADEPDDDGPDDSAAQRLEQQTLWVDLQIRQAMARGDFDDLPGAGKPLELPDQHDPDWWVKKLIERENIGGAGVLPPALGLRREDAELADTLDREPTEDGVRRIVADFNARVVEARRQLLGGPPVITATRDPDAEVAAWKQRRADRLARRAAEEAAARPAGPARRRRWWRRWSRGGSRGGSRGRTDG